MDKAKGLKNTYDLKKHQMMLATCEEYLKNFSESYYITPKLFSEMQRFSEDTYSQLCKDDSGIAILNTCIKPREVSPTVNLKMNLEALQKMLTELIINEIGEGTSSYFQ